MNIRHPSWDTLSDLITEFAQKYSGDIYDSEAGRSWDAGQFVCRLVYGPNWSTDPRFNADNMLPDDRPVPRDAIAQLRDVIENGLPVWAKLR